MRPGQILARIVDDEGGGGTSDGGDAVKAIHKTTLAILLLALVACAALTTEMEITQLPVAKPSGTRITVYRIVDEEAGVACWVFVGYHKGGISCLPLNETRLDQ
jgi:hypothetical protein